MFNMPDSFKEKNEDYITVPALKAFMRKNNNIKGRLGVDRKTLIDNVLKYAESSPEAEEEVINWIDNAVKEGIKDVYIKTIDQMESGNPMPNLNDIEKRVSPLLDRVSRKNLCGNRYDDVLKLVKFEVSGDERYCSFFFAKMVYIYDGDSLKARQYPIFVDLYPEQGIIVGRAKPKKNMFVYSDAKYDKDGNFDKGSALSLDTESEIMEALKFVTNHLRIETKGAAFVNDDYKEKMYNLLNKYTTTPKVISEMISENSSKIDDIIKTIGQEICKVDIDSDLEQDVYNVIEKYLSITYPDKRIFTAGRPAYPLRVAATDEEESKVDQRSAKEEPLQSKAVFFDNKKMIQKNKKCDSIFFMFRIINSEDKFFKVRFIVKRDYCLIKFTEHTEEADIQNVLFLFNGS